MRQRDFAWTNACGSATDECGCRRAVVRRAKRWITAQPGTAMRPDGRMNLCHLQRFVVCERREDRGQAARQHRLAHAGRSDEQQMMRTGGGNFERRARVLQSAYINQVEWFVANVGLDMGSG